MTKVSVDDINAILPQTQCQLCEFSGCKPYAEAIVSGEVTIDRCLPGGLRTLKALAILTGQPSHPYEEGMKKKAKLESTVAIDEAACIGCTKCIQACPVDAIIGAAKQMHSIIDSVCTGCDLCIPACPTDCITSHGIPTRDEQELKQFAQQSKQRYEQKQLRQQQQKLPPPILDGQAMIAAALAREKARKNGEP